MRFKVDVVAIDVENDFDRKELLFASVNEYRHLEPRYEPEVMDDVFVIGFPLGISGSSSQRGAMPVFKRGSIASEPTLDFDRNPCVLIDCRSYSGMSGSPVIASHSGIWTPPGPPGGKNLRGDTVIGTVENFLGVYSGRLRSPNMDAHEGVAEIGIVWKRSALSAVINKGVSGTKLSQMR